MERRYYPTHRGENKADQTFHSFGRHGDHTAQASFPYSPRATKHVPGLTHQSAESTPEPHGLRLTPASMRSGFIEYQQMCEQPHGETPASDITSQPVQPIHSFASGDTSSCTVSAAVRVPTSPDEDNTAESPAKGLSGLRCSAEEPFLAAMPLQTIMENISTTDTGDVVRKVRIYSCGRLRVVTRDVLASDHAVVMWEGVRCQLVCAGQAEQSIRQAPKRSQLHHPNVILG